MINPIFKLDGMYSIRSEAYEVTTKIFDVFYRKALEDGALPTILIFPDIHNQRRSRQGKQCRYFPLLDDFHSKEYRLIDALRALEPHESKYS